MKSTDAESTDNRRMFLENRPMTIRQSNKTRALKQGMMLSIDVLLVSIVKTSRERAHAK